MNKRVLLICPHFMGYDEIITSYLLSNQYEVFFIDSDKCLKPAREEYKRYSIFLRLFLKSFPKLRELIREKLLSKRCAGILSDLDDIKNIDYTIVINGDGLSKEFYNKLSKKYPYSQKILYIWDDLNWLFKKNHIKSFDNVFSYNIDDCKKNNFSYLPVFTAELEEKNYEKEYDISIIATASQERVRLAKEIFEKYKNEYKFYIYFYDKESKFDFFSHTVPLSYEKYQKVLAKSVAILDIVRYGQKGPTTRIYDSILTRTKVITKNKFIKKYPVYNSNILILDKNYEIPSSFIKKDFNDAGVKCITVKEWFQTLID